MQSIHILGECWLFWTGICFTSSCCSLDLPGDPRFHGSHGEGWLTSSVRCKGWWWSKHRCSNRFHCAIRLRNSPVWYSFALNWLNGPKWVWLTEACSHCPQGRRKREWAGSQHPVASLAVSDLTEHKSGLGTVMKWSSGAKAEKPTFHRLTSTVDHITVEQIPQPGTPSCWTWRCCWKITLSDLPVLSTGRSKMIQDVKYLHVHWQHIQFPRLKGNSSCARRPVAHGYRPQSPVWNGKLFDMVKCKHVRSICESTFRLLSLKHLETHVHPNYSTVFKDHCHTWGYSVYWCLLCFFEFLWFLSKCKSTCHLMWIIKLQGVDHPQSSAFQHFPPSFWLRNFCVNDRFRMSALVSCHKFVDDELNMPRCFHLL